MTVPISELEVNGLRVRVEGRSEAPVVVLAHAISTGLAFWDMQAAIWSHSFRIVRFDLKGHGRSVPAEGDYGLEQMAGDVIGILDHLKVEKAAFVGLSLGGMIGQALALKAAARLSALVLAQTSAKTPDNLKGIWDERIAAVTDGGMETQVESSLARWFTTGFRAEAPLTVAWIADMIRRTHPRSFIACARVIQNLDFLDQLKRIRVPTLAVAGTEDAPTPPANMQAIAARIPDAGYLEIDKAPHFANIEQPTAYTEHIGAFLRAKLLS